MPNYGYFLPIAENLFTSVKFLDLSPKTELKFGVPEALAENGGFEQPFAHVLLGELALNRAVSNPNLMPKCTTSAHLEPSTSG